LLLDIHTLLVSILFTLAFRTLFVHR